MNPFDSVHPEMATSSVGEYNLKQCKQRKGPSSFWMHDPELVFSLLVLKRGDRIVDVGCGPGDYTLYAASIVGDAGRVYAIDRSETMIANLTDTVASKRIKNIRPMVSDITVALPVADHCADVCLLSTVLHIPAVTEKMRLVFDEVYRVLKQSGRLTIIECKKEEMPFGPPKYMRLSPEEVEQVATSCGFEKLTLVDLGYNYLMQFRVIE